MADVDVTDILREMSKPALVDAAKIKRIRVKGRKEVYIDELSYREWSNNEIERLKEIFREDVAKKVNRIAYSLLFSDDLAQMEIRSIRRILRGNLVNFADGLNVGFEILDSDERNTICALYWYEKIRLIVDDSGEIHKFSFPVSIEFKIKPLDRLIYIYTSNPGKILKIQKVISEKLEIEIKPASVVVE